MKSAPQNEPPLLSEEGILITRTHLTVPGRTFTWGSLGIVRTMRVGDELTKLQGQPITFHLMVGPKNDPNPVSVFTTQDAALLGRIEQAINRVAERLGAERTTGPA